jgi:hypothetical protein
MIRSKNFLKTRLAIALLLAGSITTGIAIAEDVPVHVRGTITAVTDGGFTVQTATGSQTVAIAADTHIAGVVPSSLDEIKSGSFIGTANVPSGDSSRALEVVVFPESMKGSGLGDYAWDLPAHGGAKSAMTNGTVSSSAMTNGTVKTSNAAKPSAMTNGTVKSTTGTGARSLVVDYGKGEKTIKVPANVPVVTFKPADKTALVPGAHVFVAGKAGTPVNAAIVAVGLDGTVPPM